MDEDLRALIPSKGLIFGFVVTLAAIGLVVAWPEDNRSANPFSKNYDPALNNSGPKLRKSYKVEVVTERVDANGVTHQTVH